MKVERFITVCECGCYSTPLSFGLTDEKSLIITSVCIADGQIINTVFPLADLFKACPAPPVMTAEKLNALVGEEINRIVRPPLALKWTKQDERQLHSWGIDPKEPS